MSEYITVWKDHEPTKLRWGVPVVRCKDCEHYDPHPTDGGVCFLPDGDGGFAYWEVEPDGFCKWGERREP